MSENTFLYALYRMGYHSRMTGHGFRGLASTILNEHSCRSIQSWLKSTPSTCRSAGTMM